MKGEKGQALPLAMMALTIGSLLITPFLGHAGTSLISSRDYAGIINARNAADAGVEHAIWRLTHGTLADQFTNPGDTVTYQLGEVLNGFTPSITVTANATGGGGGVGGGIEDNIIDTLIFGPTGGNTPVITPVAGNVYAIAYGDWNNYGWVKTVTVLPDGMIADTPIDTLEFDTSRCYEPDIIHVSGTTYAVVYRGQSNSGYAKTFSIAANGDIGNSVIDSLIFDSSSCYEPDIIDVSGNYYAVAYRGQSNSGIVKTFLIASSGNIGNSVKDSLTFDASGYEPSIEHVSGDYYAIAYRGASNRGYLKTVGISSGGNINNTATDTFIFNQYSCYYPDIVNVSGGSFAISYTGASPANGDWWGGILTTVSIAANGNITKSITAEIVFDADDGDYADIIAVGGGIFAIAFTGGSSHGTLKTVAINPNGTIPDGVIDTLIFENGNGFYPHVIAIDADTLAVVYTGSGGWVGILKTIGIGGGTGGMAAYQIKSTAGGLTINALVNTDNTTASIVSWQIH
ncbi:MAG: hypothetical protein WC370_09080 [Dehalococcoidales bacterium]|jgi:hypothetical protein